MYEAAMAHFPEQDMAILSAAVADYRVKEVAEQKMKREHTEEMTLSLVQNPDIAASLGAIKRADQKLIGFALETHNAMQHGADKLIRKNLDMIVINSLQDTGAGFGCDTNKISLLFRSGEEKTFELKSKQDVAKDILDHIV